MIRSRTSGFQFLALLAANSAIGPAIVCQGQERCPGADLFTNGIVHRLRIELAPDAAASLKTNARRFVSATVSEGTTTYAQVGVRLKGSVGSFRPLDDKPGLTLDFGEFKESQRFHGLRRIHLNNSVEDPSYVNEKLGSELFLAAGIPAPRVARALVVLNGRAPGLYVLKEGFTEDFLSCHFKQVGSELYEPDPALALEGIGSPGHPRQGLGDVNERLKRNSVRAPVGDRTALKALAVAALEADPTERWERLERVLDMDRFLPFMAMEVMLGHRDGYCLARNNFRVYHDPDSGRMIFFPHGMDQLFGTADLPWQPSFAGLVAKAVITTPEGKERYADCFGSLFTNVFKTALLTSRVDELVQELRPVLSRGEWARVKDAAALVKARIEKRRLDLVSQLNRPALRLMEFTSGVGHLEGWRMSEQPAKGRMDRVTAEGVTALHIKAAADSAASWRTTALLPKGRYRFEGQVRAAAVQPIPAGKHQGAGLRVTGHPRQVGSITGDTRWRKLALDFQVDQLTEEVEFICELRARNGEVWFDLNSLDVIETVD